MFNIAAGVALRVLRMFIRTKPDRVVVLPPTSAGSLGDHAMLDSACNMLVNTYGKTPVLVSRSSDGHALRNDVEVAVVDAPGLMAKWHALRQILSSENFLFIGADVIDGVYGGDCKRLGYLDLAARAGLNSAALGFSFSDRPGQKALARLHNLPPIPLHPRDPVSKGRLEAAVPSAKAVQVADLAFLLTPEAQAATAKAAIDWANSQRDKGQTVLGVNAGGTTLSKMKGDGLQSLGDALDGWLQADASRSILFVPHDYRPQPVGDVEPLQSLLKRLQPEFGDRVHMVDFPFNSWDAKAIAGALDFTLTARMHFAIACLGQGVPPLCVTYVGKFEGLMQHFTLKNMLLSPDEAISADAILARLNEFEARVPDMKAQISEQLPAVRALSKKNFAWLNTPTP